MTNIGVPSIVIKMDLKEDDVLAFEHPVGRFIDLVINGRPQYSRTCGDRRRQALRSKNRASSKPHTQSCEPYRRAHGEPVHAGSEPSCYFGWMNHGP